MNKYIEITVRKKTISVIADNIGNKKKGGKNNRSTGANSKGVKK